MRRSLTRLRALDSRNALVAARPAAFTASDPDLPSAALRPALSTATAVALGFRRLSAAARLRADTETGEPVGVVLSLFFFLEVLDAVGVFLYRDRPPVDDA